MPSIKVFDNFIRGTLTGAHSTSGTTLTASGLTALRTITSGLSYATVIIDPLNAAGHREVVRVSAHGAAAGTATIEALTMDHDDGEDYVVAATSEDFGQSIDRPWGPATASADVSFDREEATTLPAGASWVNQGGASFTEKHGIGSLVSPTGANQTRGIVWPLPVAASAYTVTGKFSFTGISGANAYMGLIVRLASSDLIWQVLMDHAGAYGVHSYATSGSAASALVSRSSKWGGAAGGGPVYLQYQRISATSHVFRYGMGGPYFYQLGTNSGSFTPDEFGFAAHIGNGADNAVECHWLRVRA